MENKKIAALLKKHNLGVKLDIGCGDGKQKGFVGMDVRPLPGVDLVHDMEKFPWPLPNESVSFAMASHVVEHINPANRMMIKFMDEVWRVLQVGGSFAISLPYAGSFGYWQDPTHMNGCNEATWAYFDPMNQSGLYFIYRPKPWKILNCVYDVNGIMEVLLEKRQLDQSYHHNPKDYE